jgi:hypothetical protein
MVYSTQNYWGFGLFPSSGVLGSRNTIRKLDLLPSSGERGEKTPTQFGPLERSSLNHWDQIQFLICCVFTPKDTGRWKMSKTPVIMCKVNGLVNTVLMMHNLQLNNYFIQYTIEFQLSTD